MELKKLIVSFFCVVQMWDGVFCGDGNMGKYDRRICRKISAFTWL